MSESERATSFSYKDLIRSAEGKLFGSDAPRLPKPNMLMMDEIEYVSDSDGKYGNGQIKAKLKIHPDHWFFKCHFQDDPVMPGCLGLDAMWQLMGFFLAWLGHKGKGRALGVKDLKFTGQILPTSKIVRYIIDIKRVMDMKLTMVIADGTLEVDGKPIYMAKDMRVGIFAPDQLF